MAFVGLGAKLLLRGLNTTVVHGGEYLEKAINERGGKTALLTVINHQVINETDSLGIVGYLCKVTQMAVNCYFNILIEDFQFND